MNDRVVDVDRDLAEHGEGRGNARDNRQQHHIDCSRATPNTRSMSSFRRNCSLRAVTKQRVLGNRKPETDLSAIGTAALPTVDASTARTTRWD
jgi:hypothetical protein